MNKLFQLIISVIIFGALAFGLSACGSESETLDLDRDGDAIADINDSDSDGDGVPDEVDDLPYDATASVDSDGDGVGDNNDALPYDATASVDSDGDGVGDNADALPYDATESADTDGDGVGDNIDVYPNDATRSYAFANKLNDTGITWGGNYPEGNNTTCIGETIAEQDCSHGRDVTANNDADGHAGFSFSKIDSNGNALPASASSWDCVLDNVTGLMWEVKTDDGGIHDRDNTYRWGGKTARLNGSFRTVYNDWDTLVDGANAGAGLCGYTGWHVPSREALFSIVSFDGSNPAIDTGYFPNTQSSTYYSASSHSYDSLKTWFVGFGSLTFGTPHRDEGHYVRLVRVGQ